MEKRIVIADLENGLKSITLRRKVMEENDKKSRSLRLGLPAMDEPSRQAGERFSTRLVASCFILSTFAFGGGNERLLPQQKSNFRALNAERQAQLSRSEAWTSFTSQHGAWSVQWNEATRTPHRAFGPSIQLADYPQITTENVYRAAAAFLAEQQPLLRADIRSLRPVRAVQRNSIWYVSYRQAYQGLDVLFSEVELRLSAGGKAIAFGADVYDNIALSTSPAISQSAARAAALAELPFVSGRDRVTDSDQLFILPVRNGTETSFHLVYAFIVFIEEPFANYLVLVDAHSGQLRWLVNQASTAGTKVRMTGAVPLTLPTDSLTAVPLPYLYADVNGTRIVADATGLFTISTSSPVPGTAKLEGRWVRVLRSDSAESVLNFSVSPGDSQVVEWNDSNSHAAERSAYVHVNRMRDFLVTLDPFAAVVLDNQMVVKVNSVGACNAFYGDGMIVFYGSGNGCPNMALIPGVAYHEYTHLYTDAQYRFQGQTGIMGMTNVAANEGCADIGACLFENTPLVARGFRGPGTFVRDISGGVRYPDDVTGNMHNDGLVLAGTFWKIRELTSLDLARHLWSWAIYGYPDDLDLGVACSEWFLETLIADDNDANLGNGTPHFAAIADAFNAHGIGTGLFMSSSVIHSQLKDTQDTTHAYHLEFSLSGVTPSVQPESVRIHYYLNGSLLVNSLPASLIGGSLYAADIPAQPAGTLVQYYMSAFDPVAGATVVVPQGAPISPAYAFTVGMLSVHREDFEQMVLWKVGAPGDRPRGPRWEYGVPEGTRWNNVVLYQPDADHTPGGTRCFVTGAKAGLDASSNDVDSGTTTLLSPEFDLRSVNNPVIRYAKWYQNTTLSGPLDRWVVQVSTNGGDSWIDLENTGRATGRWEMVTIPLNRFVSPGEHVQFRFLASDEGPDSDVEAAVDDFEILGIGPPIVISWESMAVDTGAVLAFSDSLYRIDPNSGACTVIGKLQVQSLRAITVQPTTGLVFGIDDDGGVTSLSLFDPRSAYHFPVQSLSVGDPRSIFYSGDTLFLAGAYQFSRMDPSGNASTLASFSGLPIQSVAASPGSRTIWAIVPFAGRGDLFCRINLSHRVLEVVGLVNVSDPIVSLAVDPGGRVFGMTSSLSGMNTLVSIDATTGQANSVCTLHASGLRGIAFDQRLGTVNVFEDLPANLPQQMILGQNYPNPFNSITKLQILNPKQQVLKVSVYDILGREIAVLMNEEKEAGRHTVTWQAMNQPSGVYFYQLRAGEQELRRKMVLLR